MGAEDMRLTSTAMAQKYPHRWHWMAPTLMLLSAGSGCILAVGHHTFYNSLNGTPVRDALFSQQVNTGIGTAFAFLVRTALVVSIGAAYTQVFWNRLKDRPLPLSTIDALYAVRRSLVKFFDWNALTEHPLLVFLALLSWTVPFAAIVPPATLSVHLSPILASTTQGALLSVPDYENGTFTQNITQHMAADNWYTGPTYELVRVVMGAGMQGQIASITPPAVNSSYTLKFFSPTLQCEPLSPSILEGFSNVVDCDVLNNTSTIPGIICTTTYQYFAWAPDTESLVPFTTNDTEYITFVEAVTYQGGKTDTVGSYGNGPASLFVATSSVADLNALPAWSALNCSLYNASYTVDFSFFNGHQLLHITELDVLDSISAATAIAGPSNPEKGTSHADGYKMYATQSQISYQALMDTFGRLLVGTVAFVLNDVAGNVAYEDATSVLSTRLIYSRELAPIYNNVISSNGFMSPQVEGTAPLSAMLEELFHNITLSAFSNPLFLRSNIYPTTVTIQSPQNMYVYTWRRLVAAYSCACIVTLLTVVVGFHNLNANGVSYSENFSTIVRLTNGDEIRALVAEDTNDGADPLPECLARAEIVIDGRGRG